MVHPLVIDTERPFNRSQMGNGILGQHCQPIGGDQIRDTVMDFRVNMVRTSCQNDTPFSVFIHPIQGFLSFAHDVFSAPVHFQPGFSGRMTDFFCRDIREFFYQPLGDSLFAGQSQEGIVEPDAGII